MPSSSPARKASSHSRSMSTGVIASASRFWRKTYAGDYIGLLVLALGNGALFLTEPFHKMFSLDDPRIQFPHAEVERVGVPMLLVAAIAVPLVAIIVWTVILGKGKHFLMIALLGLSNSVLLTSFVTDFIKQGVGRPRPDLISRCKPKEGTPHNKLVSFEVCNETNHHTLHDGFRSFPSGHSSTSFAGLFFLTLFFCGQFFVFRPGADLSRAVLAFTSTMLALYIAISRLEDYRHDYADVTVGAWIGIICATISYRRYFPSLWSPRCNEPLKIPNENSTSDYDSLRNDEDEDDGERGRGRRPSDIEMGRDDIDTSSSTSSTAAAAMPDTSRSRRED